MSYQRLKMLFSSYLKMQAYCWRENNDSAFNMALTVHYYIILQLSLCSYRKLFSYGFLLIYFGGYTV